MQNNIIYIHSHDSGDVFSPYGYKVITPTIESFASDATVFENAFCASPTCSPSRSALLTGMYPHSNGMVGLANRGFTLKSYDLHVVRKLKANGYRTALCGIQHEYGRYVEHEKGAQAIGYDENISAENIWDEEKDYVFWDNANTKNAVNWIGSVEKSKPFFLSVGYFCTHREYPDTEGECPEESLPAFLDNTSEVKKDFLGHMKSLEYLDDNINKLISALKQHGLYDNTIIVLTSDHGVAFPKCKCTLFDSGTKVSLIVRFPQMGHGKRIRSLVSHVDVFPTIFDYCNFEKDTDFQGVSRLSLLESDNDDNIVFSEINCHTSYEPCRSVRNNKYKYIEYFDSSYPYINPSNIDNSISKDEYLQNTNRNKTMKLFFDLSSDPYEKNNLYDNTEYSNEITTMQSHLKAWQEKTDDYLLRGQLEFRKPWVINTNECLNPRSKNEADFISY